MSALLLVARRTAAPLLTCRTSSTFNLPSRSCRQDETDDVKRARLIYQSRKRGTLENGILLSSFTAKYMHRLNQQQLVQLDRLLNVPDNDWQLYYWITGRETAPPEFECEVLKLLKEHCQQHSYPHNQQAHINKKLIFLK